ncbi:MAG: glycosyltransferase [Clostridia bacterium]|nr:glycosyltransferase [Clostridia bacterium]
MQTVSLCMIVKDEENTLEKCLASVQDIADEIIIVDTGSTDRIKEIARGYTGLLYDFAWIDDFSAARNFSFGKATKDYLFWLDADDILLPGDRAKFESLKESLDGSIDAVMMKYNTGFDTRGNVTFSYFRERLVKRSRRFQWCEPVHEYLRIAGNIVNSDVCITHTKTDLTPSGRNIAIYQRLLSQRKCLSPRGLYYYARELKDNGRYPEAIEYLNRFLQSGKGWAEDNITACAELARCYEIENKPEQQFLSLTRSFLYDTPRAEICCQIGYFYKARGDFERAAFWFHLAATLKKPENSLGFIRDEFWGYVPCIELSLCYDRLGCREKAEHYNELAGKFKSNDPLVEYNRSYFNVLKADPVI